MPERPQLLRSDQLRVACEAELRARKAKSTGMVSDADQAVLAIDASVEKEPHSMERVLVPLPPRQIAHAEKSEPVRRAAIRDPTRARPEGPGALRRQAARNSPVAHGLVREAEAVRQREHFPPRGAPPAADRR